jgi:hypothetical protein
VEQRTGWEGTNWAEAVNPLVIGSNPIGGAILTSFLYQTYFTKPFQTGIHRLNLQIRAAKI